MNDWLWHSAMEQQFSVGDTVRFDYSGLGNYIDGQITHAGPGYQGETYYSVKTPQGHYHGVAANGTKLQLVAPAQRMQMPDYAGPDAFQGDTPEQLDQMVNYAAMEGEYKPTYRAIRAVDVKPGMRVRMPEGRSAFEIKYVTDAGMGQVKLDAGWGSCTLDRGELVDEEVWD